MLSLLTTLILALVLGAGAPAVASASTPIHVAGTGGEGLSVRSEPSTSGTRIAVMPEGTTIDPSSCYVRGESVNGTPIWWRTTYQGVTGYAASAFDDSKYSSDAELTAKYGIPACDSNSASGPASPSATADPPPTAPAAATPNTPAAGTTTDCGYSDDNIISLQTAHLDGGKFEIKITPTRSARIAGPTEINGDQIVVNAMWHAVQRCVPNLYGHLADSIYQQLQCHSWGGVFPDPRNPIHFASGPTYDLESWHLPLAHPGLRTYYQTHCLNYDNRADRVLPDDGNTG